MKKIIILSVATLMCSCGIYKPYTRPEVQTEGLYGPGIESADTTTLGDLPWRKVFTDPRLQTLIEEGLANNTDLQSAQLRVKEAEAALKTARLSFLPSFNLAPQGGVSSFDNSKGTWTYNVPITASWEIDVFSRLRNSKLRAKALYAQSEEYRRAVQTQLIAGIANYYYTLLMLDEQYAISSETAENWRNSVETMRAMKEAGMTTEAAVAQTEATYYSVVTSLKDLAQSIRETENGFSVLLGSAARNIERGTLDGQWIPEELAVGVPVQMLTNRPDIRAAENNLMSAYYATAAARSALYPKLTLSGSAGWTNNAGAMIVNPGKLLLSAAGQLLQPIFNAGANRAQVKIAKAQQQEAMLAYEQSLLNAGKEVNDALTQCQTSRDKRTVREQQIVALERAVESTELLMQHGTSTYLEVLTAQQGLLSARLSQVTDRFDELQGFVNLYQALGGGRETTQDGSHEAQR